MAKVETAFFLVFEALGKVEDMNNAVPDDMLDEATDKLYEAMNLLAEEMNGTVASIVRSKYPTAPKDVNEWIQQRMKEYEKEDPLDALL